MNDLHLDRLRIKVERNGSHRVTEKYIHDNLPEELVPYVQQAIQDLKASGNPSQSRTYQIGNDRIHVRYKPLCNKEERVEPESWFYKFHGMPYPRKKRRVWP